MIGPNLLYYPQAGKQDQARKDRFGTKHTRFRSGAFIFSRFRRSIRLILLSYPVAAEVRDWPLRFLGMCGPEARLLGTSWPTIPSW